MIFRLNRRARLKMSRADDTAAFLALVIVVFAWLLWIARPAFVPLGHGPDLTHHLLLVDFIERRWQLPHDLAMEGYLGEFFHYTPGAHLLTSLAGAWFHIGGFRAAHPVVAAAVALKAGFVFLIARRVVTTLPLAIAAVVLSFAPQAYVIGSFTHDFFFAQVVAELFAVALWWAITVWDDAPGDEALVVAALAGVAAFLTWPIWIGPLLLMFGLIVFLRESIAKRERVNALLIGAGPVAVVAAIYVAGRIQWLSIVRTTGGVTWPTPGATGWLFTVLALTGIVFAVRWRRARTTVLLVAAIAAQAAALFALAKRSPSDTPYMALKMMYLAVYPLAVCGAVALEEAVGRVRLQADRRSAWIAWLVAALLFAVVVRDLMRTPRDAPVVSVPLYRAGEWARANVPPSFVEYLVGNPDTAYWLHLAVLGNPRASARTADVETFVEGRALVRWIEARGLPYAIADLTVVPRDVRDGSQVLVQFDTAAVLERNGAASCK
jgi:hypothetical protein